MKAQSSGNKYKRGVITLEILIAFTLLILCMSAVLMIYSGNQSVAVDSELNNEALARAQKILEEARAASRFDFNLVNPSTSSETIGGLTYTKTLGVSQVDLFTKQATSTVTWQSGGRTLSAVLSTLFTNPQVVSGGNTCSSVLSGNWKNPQITTYEFGKDLIGDPSSGFPITAVDVYKGKLFVAVNNSNGNNSPTFFEFSLANPTSPTLIASMDNDPTVKLGLNSISAKDTYAYTANGKQSDFGTCTSGSCGQLQVIDVSLNPPQVKTTFKIPGVKGKNGQSIGQTIVQKNDYVYLGLTKTLTGPEFNIIDVSNPLAPVYKGGYSVGNTVNAIFVKDNFAYIATPNSENLTILDITNPSAPVRVGGYSPSGGSNGESVTVIGQTVYLGRTFGTNEFHILNAANPGSLVVIAAKDIGTGNGTSINSLYIRDYLAFFITNSQFQVWNIANPSNIYPWTPNNLTSEFLDLPGGKGTAIGCEGNYMYVGSLPANDKGYISIITTN